MINFKKYNKLILGLDTGGGSAKCGISDMEGNILHRFVVKTYKGDTAILNWNKDCRKEIKGLGIDWDKQIVAVGFGMGGALDLENGISLNAGKIGWHNYPYHKVATSEFKKPIFVINDARAIVVGEWKKGAGKGYKNILTFSLGTGLGGGIVLNDQLYRGAHNWANEFGHGGSFQKLYQCDCGLKGCIEGSSSATGIEKYFQRYIKENPKSSLAKLQSEKGDRKITIKDASHLFIEGDKDAVSAFKTSLFPLSSSISAMVFAFDPELVLVGGGPSALGKPLIDLIKSQVKTMLWKNYYDNTEFKLCSLRNDAGLVGIIEFTLEKINKELKF